VPEQKGVREMMKINLCDHEWTAPAQEDAEAARCAAHERTRADGSEEQMFGAE
jgi:hypothetical protein